MDQNIADEALMESYAKGDTGAFEELLRRHRRPVFAYLCRMAGSELAEDIFQEVFIRVISSRATYKRTAKFSTWLYRIAHNTCVDALRRENYRKTESLFQPADPRVAENGGEMLIQDIVPSSNPGPAEELARKQLSDALKKCIARLNPEQREVFVLRQYQNLPFQEIARVVGTSESTVKSRMRYALNNLRSMLVAERIVEGVTL
ncbi:MAG: RNA polymerase sigma factor [Candidatus Lindowbacteria bacterium]|nr:RNA polymerase sigma factor [Candidatus Lindowbacteria bacterium]